jgi:hypothetical protein
MARLKNGIFHPFLFGVDPVLALLASNISQIGPMFVIRPALIMLALVGLLVLVWRPILKNWHRAALAATLLILLLIAYGYVHPLVSSVTVAGIAIGKNRNLTILWAVLYLAGAGLILKKIKTPSRWTGPLNLIGLLLLGLSVLQIAFYEIRSFVALQQRQAAGSASIASQLQPQSGETLPDIYYIMPEDYQRSDSLKKVFGYDNSSFLASLEQMGFYIATCSQANYNTSDASLAAALNIQYLAALNNQFNPPNTDLNGLYPYIQNSTVLQTLQAIGYKLVAFQSGYSPTEFRNADFYLSPQGDIQNLQLLGGMTAFEAELFRTPIGDIVYSSRFFPLNLRNTLFNDAYLLDRNRMLYELQKLAEVPSLPGPKFVWVHLLAPHNPFVFGPHGEVLQRNTPFTLNDDRDAQSYADYNAGYGGEINYLDTLFLEDIRAILKNSTRPAIILLQSDDGSSRSGIWSLAELNAYYLPQGGGRNLYPTISPVNSFRVIFNTYFGGHLDLLKDQACDSPRGNPYHCTPVVDPNPQCAAQATP